MKEVWASKFVVEQFRRFRGCILISRRDVGSFLSWRLL